jgi:exopolyphosphatase/guanosine-5'-triphosphate,3'-diphosphate pyrophosphatase
MGETLAAIDCGTNSTRLLVWREGEALDRRMVITRLGEGVDRTRRFGDGLARTLDVLRDYRSVMDSHGVARVRCVATSAARDAHNRDELVDGAEAIIGVRPELLSGDEEGALSFRGATAELSPDDGPFLVCDIGGGSTELAFGVSEPTAVRSVDVGCVRLTEQWIHSDPPAPEELHAAISVTTQHLEDVGREHPEMKEWKTVVGLAGTVSTVAAVEIGLTSYSRDAIHGFTLTREAAEDVFRTLATEPRSARVHNPGLEEARADVIVGGCCALVAFMRYFEVPALRVSESDILDGLVLSMLA